MAGCCSDFGLYFREQFRIGLVRFLHITTGQQAIILLIQDEKSTHKLHSHSFHFHNHVQNALSTKATRRYLGVRQLSVGDFHGEETRVLPMFSSVCAIEGHLEWPFHFFKRENHSYSSVLSWRVKLHCHALPIRIAHFHGSKQHHTRKKIHSLLISPAGSMGPLTFVC